MTLGPEEGLHVPRCPRCGCWIALEDVEGERQPGARQETYDQRDLEEPAPKKTGMLGVETPVSPDAPREPGGARGLGVLANHFRAHDAQQALVASAAAEVDLLAIHEVAFVEPAQPPEEIGAGQEARAAAGWAR